MSDLEQLAVWHEPDNLLVEEIKRLRAKIERLTAALQQIADIYQRPMSYDCEPIDIARRALEDKP